ncbi:MAG TPA: thiamine pyrophosphate-binding protein [Thermoleophilia bacterium]|nr:thiamine pyrophosphate-binding protein [Thermoleophilia bacterium]
MSGTVRVSDYVVRFLEQQGVQHVFMLVGGAAMHLNDAVGSAGTLRYVCDLHEQACAIAAEAYAKYDNRLGVVVVTAGPGGTNAITGVAGAWLDSTPLLVLSGQVKRADLKGDSGVRNRGPQELDLPAIVQGITKYAVTVQDPRAIRYHLEKACHLAMNGRPGPVWLELPLDVQAAQIDPDDLEGYEAEPDPPATNASDLDHLVAQTLDLLEAAERPFLLFGNGVRLAGAVPDARRLVDALPAPFGLTWPALDFIEDAHPGLVGRPGSMAPRAPNFALQNADVLVTVGARMDLVCTAFAPDRLARGATKVMVDVDAAEIAKLEPFIDVAIAADAGDFLRALLRRLSGRAMPSYARWRARCDAWRAAYPMPSTESPAAGPVSMYSFTRALCEQLPEGALVVPASSGNAVETFLLAYRAKRDQRVFLTTGLGAMGFGLPAGIGACIASGRRPTVCLEGDGGFQMNVQELEVVARLGLPLKFFVVENGGYGSIVSAQSAYFGRLVGATPESGLTLPSTLALAEAYGLPTDQIDDQRDVEKGISRVLATPGPCVCRVTALRDEPRQPRVASFQKPDGSMASRPLEDMFPFLPRDEFLANMIVPPVSD